MRILLAGARGVIGRQAVPVLAAAGHRVTGLARTPARLPDAEVVAADALDAAAVARAVRAAAPDVIVHMATAVPDPVDPRHLARDMAPTNRLRTQGTANLLRAAGGGTTRRPSWPRRWRPRSNRNAGSPRPAGWCCGWATSTARAPATPPTAAWPGCSAPAGSR